jgi:oligopeptide/dipeptide ABC transporter ATP-binding protein
MSEPLVQPALPPGVRPGAADATLFVDRVEKKFRTGGTPLRAVDGVSFDVRREETFGIVGESGCGKSTLARCILRLIEPTAGSVRLGGIDVGSLGASELRRMRLRMQMVFQDPYSSLDPRMSVRAIVEEGLAIHGIDTRERRLQRAEEMLELVGITRAQMGRKPHEFSGGQRQRVGVARALVLHPELVVLDEPISALDVSVQAQVLNLLRRLQQQLGLTYVFIVHDLSVAEYFCDRVAVLYLGAVMEIGDRESLFRQPLHPYTVSLLSAVPIPDPSSERRRSRIMLRGEVSALGERSTGCRFRPRCPLGRDREICAAQEPALVERTPGTWAACHFPGELTATQPAAPTP